MKFISHALTSILAFTSLCSHACAADFDIKDEAEFLRCVPVGAKLEKIAGDLGFTEGCQWIPRDGGYLVFSDVKNSRLHKWTKAGGLSVFREPSGHANGNTLDNEGRLISCEQSGRRIARLENDGKLTTLADKFEGKRFTSPNDVAVHPVDGSVWFSDPDYGMKMNPGPEPGKVKELDGNFLFRLDAKTGALSIPIKDFDHPNGLCFSPDGTKLYVNDSGATAKNTRVFDVHPDGSLTGGKVIAKVTTGSPDGIRCDREGRLWCTGDGGVKILRPDGTLIGIILVPTDGPTNCCFGGDDMQTLFITARPSVYAIHVGVKGVR